MPRPFHSTGITTCAHAIGGRTGRRAGLDPLEKKMVSYFARNRTAIPRLHGLSSGQYVPETYKGQFTHTMPRPCRDPTTTLPFSESVEGGQVAHMPFPFREPAVALRGRFQNGIFMAWQGSGMTCVNQTR
jgi:hypothetical protein